MDIFKEIWKSQEDLNKRITGKDTKGGEWVFKYITAMEQEIAELKDCLNWKWWSKEYQKHKPLDILDEQNLKVEIIDILHFLISVMQASGLTPEQVYNIYKQKNKINHKRQDNGYNHINKTEDDNKSIQV